jgi:UDP-GlcNAc:undecaprenyl-phosphate/decaprenyl-phosphate GlcNAc-1-phosphate transferase
MDEFLKLLGIPLIISFFVAYILTPVIIKFAPTLKILDIPGKRGDPATLHTKPIPRGGGIPVLLGILAASVLLLPIDQRLAGILIGATVVVAIGFLDDRKNASPYLRLAAQFIAAGVVVASGVGIAFITNPITGGVIDLSILRFSFNFLDTSHTIWILSSLFGLFWIVFLMNAVSWSSGVDGQLSGFTTIAAGTLALLSLKFSADITQWPVTILAAAVCGAFLGFLPWHAYPQKIMPGFGGGTLAGFMLAILSILSAGKVGTLLVVLAIPIADTLYTITRRLLSGKSPVWGDKKHLHHRLLEAGWKKKDVAIFYWIATSLLGILALTLNTLFKFYTIIGAGLFVGGFLLWLISLSQSSKQQDRDSG